MTFPIIKNEELIFGSTAMAYWFPGMIRKPRDLDIISTSRKGGFGKGIEFYWVDGFRFILDCNTHDTYVNPDFLYTIKVSHAAWDIKWDKTMFDIILLKHLGCKLNEKLYQLLYQSWECRHGHKKIKVAGNAKDFFNSNVSRKIDHEQVHELVKFYERPMHERIREDLNDVKCSKELWTKLDDDDKIKTALEETYVFALERYGHTSPTVAFNKALKHLITQSTKGWFNLFLIENFNIIIKHDKQIFINHFQKYREITNAK